MARSFSTKEAQILIEAHRKVLQKLVDIQKIPEELRSRIGSEAIQLVAENAFAELARKELILRQRPTEITGISRLLATSMAYLTTPTVVNYCKAQRERYQADIESNLKTLLPATKNLQWFFTLGRQREKACESYEWLSKTITGEYAEGVQSAEKALERICQPTQDAVKADFEQNPERYATLISNIVPGIMEMEQSVAEVVSLVTAHRQLAERIDAIITLPEQYGLRIKELAQDLVSKDVFAQATQRELLSGSSQNMPLDVLSLLADTAAYSSIRPIANRCKTLRMSYQREIENGLNALTIATQSVRWAFATVHQKDAASRAYTLLTDMLNGDYGKTAQMEVQAVDPIRMRPHVEVQSEFEQNSERFFTLIQAKAPGITNMGSPVQSATELIERYERLLKDMEADRKSMSDYRLQIQKAADELATQETLKVLRGVPVETINNDSKGIRTKPLRDNHYETVADLWGATVWNLTSIRGISMDAARSIKKCAADYAAKAKKGVKIKLSADDKTSAATKLIKALFDYKRRNDVLDSLDELERAYEGRISSEMKHVRGIGNGVQFFFMSQVDKRIVIQSFRDLDGLLSGDYGLEAQRLHSAFNTFITPDREEAWVDFERNTAAYFAILEELVPGLLGTDDVIYGLPEDLAREIQDECFFPEGLLCKLRRYQEWGVKYILHQGKVLLGDEMGLGKTVQAIAVMVSLRNTGATHFAVVCPASVVTNWNKEIRRHSKLRATQIYGRDRKDALKSWIDNGGVAVTTFETVAFFDLDDAFRFSTLIVDEAHYIKNPEAKRTINLRKLSRHADRLLFMTGTALENKVDEMIALIRLLKPRIAAQIKDIAFMSSASQFRDRIAPVYYRRKREDVLTELPELIESREWCVMSAQEEVVYENAVLSRRYADARRVSWNVSDIRYSCKAQRLHEIVEEATSDNRKIIIFSFFLDTTRKVSELLGERCMTPISGSIQPQQRQEIIDAFNEAPPGAVLVSQIQSGGTGLNIQSASVVVICEPQLKPSIESQAISRAYRMGQSRNVLVYRLLCENSVDEKITDMLEQKQAVFNAFADKSVAAAAQKEIEVDEKGFGDIIKEEIERIKEKRANETIDEADFALIGR